jgi:hypothetical protein
MRGTNQSVAPIAGFEAIVFDETRLVGLQHSTRAARSGIRIWSGRDVQVYDFEFPTTRADSSQVDGADRPKYQFHLEIERVVFPADGQKPGRASFLWERESFAVAARRDSARLEERPGYFVEPEVEAKILRCLSTILYVDPAKARVLPFSKMDSAKLGKRISEHPLHDTYIDRGTSRQRKEFYEKSESGALVAEIDEPRDKRKQEFLSEATDFLPRVQRVFTMPFKDLLELWKNTAYRWHSQKS